MSARIISTLCGAAAATLATGLLHAAPVELLNDSFTDLDRTNGTDPLDSQWYYHANAQADSVSAATGSLVLLRTANTFGFNPHLVTQFASQPLATGDSIKLSFRFKSEGGSSATGIRFGLYNSGASVADQDIFAGGTGASPGTGLLYDDDTGYTVFAPHQGTQAYTLRARPGSAGSNATPVGTTPNSTVLATSSGTTATNTTDFFTPSMELTRTLTGYDYVIDYNGTILAGTTTNVTTSTFNSLSIFNINEENQPFTVDDVIVTYTAVPEPATLAAVGLAGAAFLRRRRT
jgi:hypothetical protein